MGRWSRGVCEGAHGKTPMLVSEEVNESTAEYLRVCVPLCSYHVGRVPPLPVGTKPPAHCRPRELGSAVRSGRTENRVKTSFAAKSQQQLSLINLN